LFKYKYSYLIGALLLLAVNLIGIYIPLKIKTLIDVLTKTNSQSFILKGVLIVIACALVMAFFRVCSRQIVFGLGRQVEFDLKKQIFDHLLTFEINYFSKQRTGDLISIITNDVQSIRALAGFSILNIFNTVIAFAVTLPLMFDLNVNLTWAFLCLIPLVIFSVISLSDKIKRFQDKVQQSLGNISNFLEQNISGIAIVKSYAQEKTELKRFSVENETLKQDYLKLVAIRSFIGPVMRAIASLGLVLLLFFGGKAVLELSFSAGDFAAYALLMQRLIWPVASFGWLITVLYRAQVSKKRIDSVLKRQAVICDAVDAISKNDFLEKIVFKNLNQEIKKGETISIVGKIASGKSFLANQLLRLFELENQAVLLDGICLKQIKLSSLRKIFNLVPQETFLFSTSIKENISYAKELSEAEVITLAKLVDLHEEILDFAKGYDTVVGEKGITLSGGQKQRVAIARALALDPEVLILDDAFSSLDNISAKKILKNILDLRQNKTTIFITHKVEITELTDRVFVMDAFKISAAGSFHELKAKSKLFNDLLENSKKESDASS
jgi:ATP-binding cassette subfamily B multidrug efflux pump